MRRAGSSDDRGAIMVIALFFVVFAIALLYTVVGTVEAVLFREHLQDAADTAVLSGAIMHARSMNLIVLINLVMAALLAVLLTIKLVESIAIVGAVIAGALAWVTAGATLAAIPPLYSVQQNMHNAYEQIKDPIHTALEALHDLSGILAAAAPAAALAVSQADLESHGKPTVKSGVVVPPRSDLPVTNGSFDELCGQAGKVPVQLGKSALKAAGIPALPQLMGSLSGPMESLTREFSDWFCGDSDGDGSSKPPGSQQWVERTYPRVTDLSRSARECEAHRDLEGLDGPVSEVTSPTCEESRKEEEANAPDPLTGKCPAGGDCKLGGAYDTRVAKARLDCAPTLSPPPLEYWYQERAGRVDYVWTGHFWMRQEPVYEAPVRRGGAKDMVTQPPCGPESVRPRAVGYRLKVHPGDDVNELNPVCTTEEPPEVPKLAPARGEVVHRDFVEITQILGCRRKVLENIPIDAGEQVKDTENTKSPKVLARDVTLGDENFQIRAIVQGDRAAQQALSVVRLALWAEPDPEDPLAHLARFTSLSTAQAEYFYDGGDGRGAWMWNMKWRARFRRFRLPQGDLQHVRRACEGVFDAALCQDVFALGAYGQTQFNH